MTKQIRIDLPLHLRPVRSTTKSLMRCLTLIQKTRKCFYTNLKEWDMAKGRVIIEVEGTLESVQEYLGIWQGISERCDYADGPLESWFEEDILKPNKITTSYEVENDTD